MCTELCIPKIFQIFIRVSPDSRITSIHGEVKNDDWSWTLPVDGAEPLNWLVGVDGYLYVRGQLWLCGV